MTSFLPRLVGVGSVKLIRSFHGTCRLSAIGTSYGSYEGDGKTTVTVLNRDSDYGLMIDAITTNGFQLNNGLWVLGPMIVFPKSVLGWNIESSNDITEDALSLFKIVDPTLDILVVGLDQKYNQSTPFIQTIRSFTKRHGISIEILPVVKACTTFNFLNAESRYCAAALLPPRHELPTGLEAVKEAAIRRNLRKPDRHIESK